MSLNLNLQSSQWELVFHSSVTGDIRNYQRRPRVSAIAPIEIPFLFDSRIFLVSATNLSKTWFKAGTLYYEVQGLGIDDRVAFPDFPGAPSSSADADRFYVTLNSLELVRFPRLSSQIRLRFEPVPWLDRVTLALWEYQGEETDTTEDLIQAVRAQITTLDFKVDQLLQR